MSPLVGLARSASARLAGRLCVLALAAGSAVAAPDTLKIVQGAEPDPSVSTDDSSAAMRLPGIGDDFMFIAGGELYERGDGSARLVGVLARASDPDQRFALDLLLGERRLPGELGYPPLASPNRGLLPTAYASNGGPVDEGGWRYYSQASGTLTGLEALKGALIRVDRSGPALQIGKGASNRNTGPGLSTGLSAALLQQPAAGPTLPSSVSGGDMCLGLDDARIYSASGAAADAQWTRIRGRFALTLDGLGFFDFIAGGQFVESPDGTAKLTGVVARLRNPAQRFAVDIDFSDRVNPGGSGFPPLGSPKLTLRPAAYAPQGVVDPSAWHFYSTTRGKLTGLGTLAGLNLTLERVGPAFQVGLGASGVNLDYGASGWLTARLSQPSQTQGGGQTRGGDLVLDLSGEGQNCAGRALAQHGLGSSGSHALWVPGIGEDFVFVPGGQFIELPDGTARLIGVVARTSDPDKQFAVDVMLNGRLDPGDPTYPPPGSPKKELAATAYVNNGGPADPSAWHYYTQLDGTLTGLVEYAGALVQLTRRGPAFQVGLGANGKNMNYGGSGWLNVFVLAQPQQGTSWASQLTGDFNLDLGGDCKECVDLAEGDPALNVSSAGNSAFWLPGIATDFEFEPGSAFVERRDGTATLTGILTSQSNPSLRLSVHVELWNRINPGGFGFLPAGSPKLELPPAAYAVNGGPIDPDAWRYYLDFEGTVAGLASLNGALYRVTRRGPALQVGVGANGRNLRLGVSAWMTADLLRTPGSGPALPQSVAGDINLDLDDCP